MGAGGDLGRRAKREIGASWHGGGQQPAAAFGGPQGLGRGGPRAALVAQRGAFGGLRLARKALTAPLTTGRWVIRRFSPKHKLKKWRRRIRRVLVVVLLLVLLLVASVVGVGVQGDPLEMMMPAIVPGVGGVAADAGAATTNPVTGAGGAACTGLDPADVAQKTRNLSSQGLTDIPAEPFAAYCAAAGAFGVDWTILAAVGWRECKHGRHPEAGCHPRWTVNGAGARGPMQFLGSSWRGSAGTHDLRVEGDPVCFRSGERRPQATGSNGSTGSSSSPGTGRQGSGQQGDGGGNCERTSGYGTDGNGDGIADPWVWWDATYSAARLLLDRGLKDDDIDRALRGYNNSTRYVDEVKDMAERYREALGVGGGNVRGPEGVTPRGGTELYRVERICRSGGPPPACITENMQELLDALVPKFGRGRGIGCYRSAEDGGEHPRGRACDYMVSGGGRRPSDEWRAHGQALADWLVAHARELGVLYVIWEQRIWSVARSDEGWRRMNDRGSVTQNHFDHVHISVQAQGGSRNTS